MRTAATTSAVLLFATLAAHGDTIFNLSGTFLYHDDEVQSFQYTVQNEGPVHVYTTSYGTGTAGSGFLPVLTIFDAALPVGNFLYDDETTYSRNGDADITWVSKANTTYWVYITEYSNVWDQSTNNWSMLADPFHNPDFTTDLYGLGTGPFFGPGPDGNGAQLTGNWAVTFASPDPTLVVATPEPGTWTMLLGAAVAIACARKFRWIS